MRSLRPFLLSSSALAVLALSTAAARADAVPRSAVPSIGAGATATAAPVVLPDGTGKMVTIGAVNSNNHTFEVGGDTVTYAPSGFARAAALHLQDLPISEANFTGGACSTATNDQCALQAAINYACTGRSDAIFLSKQYYHVATIDGTACYGLTFFGRSKQGTTIYGDVPNVPVVKMGGRGNKFGDVSVGYSGTPVAGADTIQDFGANNEWFDYRVFNGFNDFNGSGSQASSNHGFELTDYVNAGFLYGGGVVQGNVYDGIVSTSKAGYGALGALRMTDQVEAMTWTNVQLLGGVYSITMDATNYAISQRPAYNHFTNVYADSADKGSLINKAVLNVFTASWFSGGRTGLGYCALEIVSGNSNSFPGSHFFNSGSCGAQVDVAAANTSFEDVTASDNSVTAGKGMAPGLLFKAGASNFQVTNSRGGNGIYQGQQSALVVVEPGASDKYVITGNIGAGNLTATVIDGGTGTNKAVHDNF